LIGKVFSGSGKALVLTALLLACSRSHRSSMDCSGGLEINKTPRIRPAIRGMPICSK